MMHLQRITRQLCHQQSQWGSRRSASEVIRLNSSSSPRCVRSSKQWHRGQSAARLSQSVDQHSKRTSAQTCGGYARWSLCGARCCRSMLKFAAQRTTSWRIAFMIIGQSPSCSRAMTMARQQQADDCCSCWKRCKLRMSSSSCRGGLAVFLWAGKGSKRSIMLRKGSCRNMALTKDKTNRHRLRQSQLEAVLARARSDALFQLFLVYTAQSLVGLKILLANMKFGGTLMIV